jgi:hypothetical protein
MIVALNPSLPMARIDPWWADAVVRQTPQTQCAPVEVVPA